MIIGHLPSFDRLPHLRRNFPRRPSRRFKTISLHHSPRPHHTQAKLARARHPSNHTSLQQPPQKRNKSHAGTRPYSLLSCCLARSACAMSSSAMEALHALIPVEHHHDEETSAAFSSGEESGHVLQGWAKKKRSRRQRSEEENLALCLLMLSRSGGQQRVQAPQPASSFLAPVAEFRCSVCGKSFGSYQALGGHKTSHRVKQPSPPADAAPLVAPVAAVVPLAEPATSSTAASSDGATANRVHRCTICQKEFPTGQALGGHKRKHYDGGVTASSTELLANAAAAESEVGSTGANGSSAARAFDLNIPAVPEFVWRPCAKGKMMWEEEEEVQSPLAFKKPRLLTA